MSGLIRMAVDLRRDPATKVGALRRVGEQLGINPETLRNWVQQVEIDEGHLPGVTTAEAQRIAELEREGRSATMRGQISPVIDTLRDPVGVRQHAIGVGVSDE